MIERMRGLTAGIFFKSLEYKDLVRESCVIYLMAQREGRPKSAFPAV